MMDRHQLRYAMVAGMISSLIGLIALAYAGSYGLLLLASACVGLGSSIFHPEATRLARSASGGRHGLAQGIFQIGGQIGSAIGPLLAAFVIVPWGQSSLGWFSIAALVAIASLAPVRQVAVQMQIGDAFRAAFVTIAAFTGIGAWLAWSMPLRRL